MANWHNVYGFEHVVKDDCTFHELYIIFHGYILNNYSYVTNLLDSYLREVGD